VSWTGVTNSASRYYVYRATSSGGSYSAAWNTTSESYDDTAAATNTTYWYKVKAWRNDIYSEYSGEASALTAPAAPTGVTAAAQLAGSIQVTWTALAGANSYDVYYYTSNNSGAAAKAANQTSPYTISGLFGGSIYYVWVKAKNSAGTESAFSAAASVLTIPAAPSSPVLTPGNEKIVVSWTAVTGASSYEVYYGIGTAATLRNTVTGTSAVISGLTNDTTYIVRLQAKNAGGV